MQNKEYTLKERYNDFLDRAIRNNGIYRIPNTLESNNEREKVYNELINSLLPNIQDLTSMETIFIRKRLGVDSQILNIGEIASKYGISKASVVDTLAKATDKMIKRIKRGYATISVENTTQEDLLTRSIDTFNNISVKTARILLSEGIYSVKDLLNYPLIQLKKKYLDEIADLDSFLKNLNSTLKNETTSKDNVRYAKTLNEYEINLRKGELEKIDVMEDKINAQIEELLRRKERYIRMRTKLLSEISELEKEEKQKSL